MSFPQEALKLESGSTVMTRCLTCNGLLTREEVVCGGCGTQVTSDKKAPGMGETLSKAVNILFYASLVMTAASLFLPNTPPISHCIVITAVLLFMKRSADQMVDKTAKK